MAKQAPKEEILVELIIQLEGSSVQNRITTFKLPVLGRVEGTDDDPGSLQFETKDLIDNIVRAVRALR